MLKPHIYSYKLDRDARANSVDPGQTAWANLIIVHEGHLHNNCIVISFTSEMCNGNVSPVKILSPKNFQTFEIQSTLVISNSKGPYEILQDIRTSTYQICGTEENN